MLITTCTHCLARFRVSPQQLNARQGQVRCGRCHQVFSGFEALERFPDDDTGARLLAAREAEARKGEEEAGATPEAIASLLHEALPEIEDLGELPPPGSPVPAPVEPASPPARPSVPAAPPVAFPDEAFAQPERARPSRAWSFGVALLVLVTIAQLAYAWRAPIAMRYPALRPWLESACEAAGCVVPWVNDEALLKLEDSELLEVPGKPGEIALGARIRNLAPAAQEFPHLELTLTDLTGQAAARRVLRPVDYLGRAPAHGEVMAAGSELAIQLRLATPQIKPTGYELLLFYP